MLSLDVLFKHLLSRGLSRMDSYYPLVSACKKEAATCRFLPDPLRLMAHTNGHSGRLLHISSQGAFVVCRAYCVSLSSDIIAASLWKTARASKARNRSDLRGQQILCISSIVHSTPSPFAPSQMSSVTAVPRHKNDLLSAVAAHMARMPYCNRFISAEGGGQRPCKAASHTITLFSS